MPSKDSAPIKAAAPQYRVALIAAPWHQQGRPSIQLGCLKAFLENNDSRIKVRNLHPYLQVAAKLTLPLYQQIAANMWLSEALFAPLLFPQKKGAAERLAAREAKKEKISPFSPAAASQLLGQASTAWCEAIDWPSFDLIGFSVCFHQLFASLFLSRLIKAKHPDTQIVFGGSSILSGMEDHLQSLAGVDFCISGEGEAPLLALCQGLIAKKNKAEDNRPLASAPSPAVELSDSLSTGDRSQLADLNSLPVPDYADYFSETAAVFGQASLAATLPVEFSRGCWWNKCAFCNLNLQWQGYRRKTAQRMAEEILLLSHRHQALDFSFTDNCLPLRESREFFVLMAEKQWDLKFFAELRQEQAADFAPFRKGGLKEAQVGIESLSTGLLARMGKGGKTIDNIFAMKTAVACGVRLQGNIILHFPGSTEQERDETLKNLDYVFPYAPLQHASFFLGHSSPVHCHPETYGIQAITVHSKFAALFPDPLRKQLPLLVCGYRGDRLYQKNLWSPVRQKMEKWWQFHQQRGCTAAERPLLQYRDGGDFLLIRQEEPEGQTLNHRLSGNSRALYLFCDTPVALENICQRFTSLSERQIVAFLNELYRKRLVFKEDDRYLALAIRQ